MTESFISTSEFEVASNAVKNILGQPVEEIEITDILPPLNDITDSNKVFKGKLSVLIVDMRKSTDLTDELKSKKMVKVYRSFIRVVIQAIRYSGGYTRQFAGDGINEYGKDYWLGLIKKMYELGQEIGKSEIQVKIDLDCYLIGIYRCFAMYEEAYEILCVQAENSTWLSTYVLEDVVKQSGHWAKLKGILEKRVYKGKDYRECLDKLKSMGY